MEATILTVLGLFATVTLWILSTIKSELRDFKTEIRSDIKALDVRIGSLETRIGNLEKTTAVLIAAQENLDKRMTELTSEVKRLNQNFLEHLRHDHGIRLGESERKVESSE